MDSIVIKGGRPLQGCVKIQGSKNAVLPIISASLLCDDVILNNCPRISDVDNMLAILAKLGMKSTWNDDVLQIKRIDDVTFEIAENMTKQLRASILLAGTLLGKYKKAFVSYPGGCTIGARPIDIHLKAFEKLGARVRMEKNGIDIIGDELHEGIIELEFPSVGATENIILLACQISGETIIYNPAKEPEIDELIKFLNKLGCIITREDNLIRIKGKQNKKIIEHYVCSDRIVAGTYILATIATSGETKIIDAPVEHLSALLEEVSEMGSSWRLDESGSLLIKGYSSVRPLNIITNPYPAFPTDLQSQIMTVLTCADGESVIMENIFENRFKIVPELIRMGADIKIRDNLAIICGKRKLIGEKVVAKDLRGTAALIIAGMMAQGETVVTNAEYAKRGYCDISRDLRKLGANISYG